MMGDKEVIAGVWRCVSDEPISGWIGMTVLRVIEGPDL